MFKASALDFPLQEAVNVNGALVTPLPAETEIVAANITRRNYGIPSIGLWQISTGKAPEVLFHDDRYDWRCKSREGILQCDI